MERTDLNLFRTFDAIITHGSLSAAARELGLTASAVSHALSRLRTLLRDDLFIPAAGGVAPTARAREIAPGVRQALSALAVAIDPPPFEPERSRRTFRIGASDGICITVLPPLLRHLAQVAAGIRLRVVPLGRLDIVQQLDEARLDLALGWFGTLPPRTRRQRLFEECEAMVVRRGHDLTQGEVTPERLLSFPHLVVEFTGTEEPAQGGFFDDRGVLRRVWLERFLVASPGAADMERYVAATVPGYGAVAAVLAETDMVATVPQRLARRMADKDGLAMLPLPYEPLILAVEAVWHERSGADEGLEWLVGQMGLLLRPKAETADTGMSDLG